MINPVTVMKLLNERKAFLEDNPELYPFIKKWFGNKLERGTVIEIKVVQPEGSDDENTQGETGVKMDEIPKTERCLKIEVKDPETGFFKALEEIFR